MRHQKTSIHDTVVTFQSSDALKQSIVDCLCALGTSIVRTMSSSKRDDVESNLSEFHHQLLYFVYRLVYLQIAECKGGACGYSGPSNIVDSRNAWQDLLDMMTVLWKGDESRNIQSLGTHLWSPTVCSTITSIQLTNHQCRDFLNVLREPKKLQGAKSVDWMNLRSKDLSVAFESILELVPSICPDTFAYSLSIKEGNARKSSGAYFTPDGLIDRVLQSTLVPAIQDAIADVPKSRQESAVLALRVCDPSCGTGNFLVTASHLLARTLTDIRMTVEAQWDDVYQSALQDVVKQCIYGVDVNPLTVEVCKLVLWLELGCPNNGFTQFHDKILCGNALLGATSELIEKGIRTEYFDLISPHDDRKIRNAIAKNNRLDWKGTRRVQTDSTQLLDLSPKEQRFLIADVVCAALVWPKRKGWEDAPTQSYFQQLRHGRYNKKVRENVELLKQKHRFFHWHLAFPEIFTKGGFDVVIGNPPYLASRYLSKHQPYERRAIPRMFATAAGNWDIYIPFTELGMRILKPNGYQAYVTPNKIIGAEYARTLQREVFFGQTMLEVHDYSRLNLFDGANVAVVIVVNQKRESPDQHRVDFYQYVESISDTPTFCQAYKTELQSLPPGFISFPITASDQSLWQWIQLSNKMADVCTVSDGLSTDQAYKIAKYVTQGQSRDFDDESMVKLVNTGTIDPFHLQWGEKKIKFLGFEGTYPIVDKAHLTERYPKRKKESEELTVAIAGLGIRIESSILPPGVLSGVATVLLKPIEGVCPYALTAILNTKLYSAMYKALFGMSGMTADVLNYSSRQVAQLPLPNIEFLKPYTGEGIHLQSMEDCSYTDGLLSMLGQYGHQHVDALQDSDFLRVLEQSTLSALSQSLRNNESESIV